MKSILIVEDDITYGIMLKTWLTKKGYQIYAASNVARARKVIETETVDLILSDLRLPDHDGIDILRWLIKHERMIPLIIMTGYADIQSAVQAMKLGASDYVPKPINPDELLLALSSSEPLHLAVKQLIDAGCTAVWVPGEDMRALEVNWLIQELAGKRIPEDISLLGSENPGISEFQRPSLTTIAIPLHEMAEIAVDLVMQGDVSCLRKIELPAKLIERNSVSVLKH